MEPYQRKRMKFQDMKREVERMLRMLSHIDVKDLTSFEKELILSFSTTKNQDLHSRGVEQKILDH